MQTQEVGFFEMAVAAVVLLILGISSSKANQIRGTFLNPYVLKNASKSEKRSLSMKLTLMQFGVFLVFVFIVPFVVQGSVIMKIFNGLLCTAFLFVAFILISSVEYVRIENQLQTYLKWDQDRKQDRLTKRWLFAKAGNLNENVKNHFFEHGYSKEDDVAL